MWVGSMRLRAQRPRSPQRRSWLAIFEHGCNKLYLNELCVGALEYVGAVRIEFVLTTSTIVYVSMKFNLSTLLLFLSWGDRSASAIGLGLGLSPSKTYKT